MLAQETSSRIRLSNCSGEVRMGGGVMPKASLPCASVQNHISETRVLGEVEKDRFISCQAKWDIAGSCLKVLYPNLERIVRGFLVKVQRGCDQPVDILLMSWC